jgi:hypothetical protein
MCHATIIMIELNKSYIISYFNRKEKMYLTINIALSCLRKHMHDQNIMCWLMSLCHHYTSKNAHSGELSNDVIKIESNIKLTRLLSHGAIARDSLKLR